MKKVLVGFMALVMVLGLTAVASATAKWVDVVPVLSGDTVTLPALPEGAKLLNVQIYDDIRGIPVRNLGAVSSFKLAPGESFNFTYEDSTGRWWQLITPFTPMEGGLVSACFSGGRNCKYMRPYDPMR